MLKASNQAAQNEYDKATRDIQLGYAARAISAKEASELQQQAADKLLATLDYNHAAIALLQARDGELESERAAREQEMANQRISNYETILGLNEDFDKSIKKIDADERKADEDKLKRIDKILQGTKDIDAIIKARAVEAPPGAPLAVEGQVPGLPSDADIQKGLDEAFKHYESFFQRLKEGIADVATQWRDKLNQAITDLPTHIVEAFTNSFESLLDTFIKTGHTGPAVMKQFVSQVLQSIALLAAQLAALAFGYALLMLAFQNYHDAALAAAAGIALTALAIGLGYASRAVAPSSASSAAGGGSFGGGAGQAPGTVTINQGSGASLGIQAQTLAVMSDVRDHLSNITTAPPGDILQRGADQNPMAVGQANNEAARRDGTVSREFLQISGLRTA